ncbi:MAG: Rossmann-like and DUF2520 domain-containing protein [Bacteroidota bacterium]
MPLTVDIVGTGNVAFHFAKSLATTSHKIVSLHSRNPAKGHKFLADTGINAEIQTGRTVLASDLILLCVPDQALEHVAAEHRFAPQTTVVHCSGATDFSPFEGAQIPKYGVIYPYQTLTRGVAIDMSIVPLFIEANNQTSAEDVGQIAQSISKNVREIDAQNRLKLHLAAVFATNFSNAMYHIAADLLKETGEDFRTVEHLIQAATEKVRAVGPEAAQTGPARRGDVKTMQKHLKSLADPRLKEIYQLISDRISQASARKS